MVKRTLLSAVLSLVVSAVYPFLFFVLVLSLRQFGKCPRADMELDSTNLFSGPSFLLRGLLAVLLFFLSSGPSGGWVSSPVDTELDFEFANE